MPGGAISVHPHGEFISGYFGNITATGLAAAHLHPEAVRAWMQWYLANAHGSESGVDGVPDDRTMQKDGLIRMRGRPDSTDAYGATFLTLAHAAFSSGNEDLRQFFDGRHGDMLRVAQSILATQQPSGLTLARPQHRIAYAIDNEQVYRGLLDGAVLMEQAYGDRVTASALRRAAAKVQNGLAALLWDPVTQTYRPQVNPQGIGRAADLSQAYPDALAQAYAIYYGIVDPHAARAASLLARAAPALQNAARGDAAEYRLILQLAYHATGRAQDVFDFEAPPVCADAGWYLQLFAQ